MSWCKCYYQLSDCHNWTDDDLTLGISHSFIGPPAPDGRSTLVAYPARICRGCLDTDPEPLDPGPYYGSPDTNPDAVPLHVLDVDVAWRRYEQSAGEIVSTGFKREDR